MVLLGILYFIVADLIGVELGIFAHNPERVLPTQPFGTSLPLEEFLLLHLVVYQAALVYTFTREKV